MIPQVRRFYEPITAHLGSIASKPSTARRRLLSTHASIWSKSHTGLLFFALTIRICSSPLQRCCVRRSAGENFCETFDLRKKRLQTHQAMYISGQTRSLLPLACPSAYCFKIDIIPCWVMSLLVRWHSLARISLSPRAKVDHSTLKVAFKLQSAIIKLIMFMHSFLVIKYH